MKRHLKRHPHINPLLALPLVMTACTNPEDGGKTGPSEPPEIPRRPNILLAFGDDYGRYASIYGDIENNPVCNLINTPNVDRIAREGVLFTNAHVPAPSSTPCRSSLFSGQYFWRTGKGAILYGAEWDETIPSYPLLLEQSGYHIGFTYKAWAPGVEQNEPYGGNVNIYRKHGNKFNDFSINVMPAANREAKKKELLDEVANNFKDFLNARDGDEPFCYLWGPTTTHRDWQQGSGRELWGIDPAGLKGILPGGLADEPVVREDFADYLGECQAFDAGLGVIMDVLEETDELDNTIIVVTGDHGIPGFPRSKANLYNLGTSVALAVRYPESIPEDRVVSDFVNLMDLAPTFLEYGHVAIPAVMTGKSLKSLLEQDKDGRIESDRTYVITGRERHIHDARDGNLPYPQRAVVTERYKYIRNFKPDRWPIGRLSAPGRVLMDIDTGPTKQWYRSVLETPAYKYYVDLAFARRPYEELYDLQSDPDEVNNVAANPAYAEAKQELSDLLDRVLTETDDPRMGPEPCIYDTPEFTGLIPAN